MRHIRTLISFLFLAMHLVTSGQDSRPNILFIAVDDLKPTLGCYGDALAQTPYIDALADRGVAFSRSYCQQAVCAPSRASLLTSRYPDQTQVWDLQTLMRDKDPGIVTLPQYLRQQGYRSTGTGKIFDSRSVDSGHDTPSWSEFRHPWNEKYYNAETGKPVAYYYASPEAKDTIAKLKLEAALLGLDEMTYIREHYFPAFECADVPLDAYTDGAIANVGMELLEEAATSEDPFFLAVGFSRPHLPFNAPKQFWDLYQREDFHVAPYREQAAGSPSLAYHNWDELRSYTGIPGSGDLSDEKQLELIHAYYAATSYIDHLVGMLMAKLSELGLEENTIVVLWGDHGWHLGDHNLWCKHSNFEEATRAPLIISAPGGDSWGTLCHSPVEFTDIAPTLCELTGVKIPGYFEGESLGGLLKDPMSEFREGALSQYPRQGKMGYTLRTERYRYTRWTNTDGSRYSSELYDYQEDSLETTSFSSNTAYAEVKERLDSLVVERIAIPSTQERITFVVRESLAGGEIEALEGATVNLASESRLTGSSGQLLFTHPKGETAYRVSAEGCKTLYSTIEIDGDSTINILLERKEALYLVDVLATDYYSGQKLLNTSVHIGESELHTNVTGEVTFELRAGNYPIRLEKTFYQERAETVSISSDTSFHYQLMASHSNLKIRLKEGSTPVNNARVTVDGTEMASNSVGISLYVALPTGVDYDYTVVKEGYLDQSGTVYLLTDSTIDLQMERYTGMDVATRLPGLQIRPNPAIDYLYCDLENQEMIESIEVMDALGSTVLTKYPDSHSVILDTSGLLPGFYWLRCQSDRRRYHAIFVKYI